MNNKKTISEFNKLYKMLNDEQREAVDTVEGPVMVVAGPGTGKTQILTLRIANILKETDADAGSILALTFTEAGVSAMRKRLVEIIGEGGYRVELYTYHGFCNEVIKKYPNEFERIIGSEPITDIEQVTLLRDIITDSELKHLKPFSNNFYFLAPIRGKISELKRERVSPEQLLTLLSEQEQGIGMADDLYHISGAHKGKMKAKYADELKRVEKGRELASIYTEYELKLREKKLYDYEDMILEVSSAMDSNKELLLRLQEQYQYILADEHQDANGAQNKILELLASYYDDPNLFIVGDEKQAIFRFQGASLENFNYFKELYPSAKLITLELNYRSGQEILDSAHNLMEGNTLYNAPLKSRAGITKSEVELREFSIESSELLWVAQDIRERIEQGVLPSEIAVLYRNNADAELVGRALEGESVPYRIESNQNVLADPDIRKLLIVLYAIAEYGSSTRLVPAMHLSFLGLSPTNAYRILRHARRERLSVFDILSSKGLLKDAHTNITEALEFMDKLNNLATKSQDESVPVLFNMLVRDSGFLTYVLNSKRAGELVEKLRSLINLITELSIRDPDYTLSVLVEHLQLLEEYNIPIKKGGGVAPKSMVRLMTAHKSKGLEFDFVYILGMRDKHWGNKRSMDSFKLPGLGITKGDNDDERRLFFVALTRARVQATMSYSRESESGSVQLPSIFIDEIDSNLYKVVDTEKFESNIKPEDYFKAINLPDSLVQDKDFLNGLFIDFGLSVTALNNYLACPWQYFYRNLVRIPEPPSKHLAFGNAVHGALQYYFEHSNFKSKKQQGLPLLLKEFERVLGKQPLASAELAESLEKGREALTAWHEEYYGKWKMNTVSELDLKVYLGEVLLRGKLDKLELGEGEGDRVTVVDYKTGKQRSRNDILGKTKSSNGDYYRQLVFYKLMLELHNEQVRSTGKGRVYEMGEGVIDFIQPDPKSGKLRKEVFVIESGEVEELKDEISRVASEILNLNFWNERCEAHKQGKCKYCELRDLMR
ncbi:MAG: ATP-dependent helicase [Candidatus Pacebacteria bacterium]|nr:ATP-dependent helicase [Candidatus Paceibacterota bacterium]